MKLVSGDVRTSIKANPIPKHSYELKECLVSEFGTQVNLVECVCYIFNYQELSKQPKRHSTTTGCKKSCPEQKWKTVP
ncbi:hypothetical protein TNCT_640871 [Trichonephila clavata]|uniref:Uncharacterized protein n=1 Tax=Trichonephila clavata TaxID=2740835 RepID=A0A8X6HZG7_TRICU|nr:hypothetical protein TNCT_640871 [Trichonephila clavata]